MFEADPCEDNASVFTNYGPSPIAAPRLLDTSGFETDPRLSNKCSRRLRSQPPVISLRLPPSLLRHELDAVRRSRGSVVTYVWKATTPLGHSLTPA